jgi:hypothetical protein
MRIENLNWEKQDESGGHVAYRAKGPRGAIYGLIRNAHHPHQLFAISLGSMRVLPGWYTDRDGNIKRL